ncbi:MAG TPA: T9SS type A sorting domain-containing protein [Bacteroidia bacterium]|nr:T9SS type A sorting domain-containing protein [Bacteroidia bacterium]
MKRITTLLFACLLMTKVFAGPSLDVGYHNYTQNLFFSGPVTGLNVTANFGDSVSLFILMDCNNGFHIPDQWYFNGDSIPNTSDSMIIKIIINQSGTYSAHIDNCFSLNPYISFYVNNITGISLIKNINFLNVFPTAVTSSITIQLNSIKTNDLEISFYDMHGRQLKNDFYKNIVGEFIKNENTEALAKGIYFLRIKAEDDAVEKKFVKM